MTTSYDRRTAEDPGGKLVQLTESALRDFRQGLVFIDSALKTVREVKSEAARLARGSPKNAKAYRAVYDYAAAILDEVDKTKFLNQNWLTRWFGEFASETKAWLQDL